MKKQKISGTFYILYLFGFYSIATILIHMIRMGRDNHAVTRRLYMTLTKAESDLGESSSLTGQVEISPLEIWDCAHLICLNSSMVSLNISCIKVV